MSKPSLHSIERSFGLHVDDFTCTICFEMYTKPQTLPCLHSYCSPCLQRYSAKTPSSAKSGTLRKLAVKNDSVLPCPQCREMFNMKHVRNDFRLQTFLERFLAAERNSRSHRYGNGFQVTWNRIPTTTIDVLSICREPHYPTRTERTTNEGYNVS